MAMPIRDTDQAIDEFTSLVNKSVQLRALIIEEGYTEVKFRNPETNEVRVLFATNIPSREE